MGGQGRPLRLFGLAFAATAIVCGTAAVGALALTSSKATGGAVSRTGSASEQAKQMLTVTTHGRGDVTSDPEGIDCPGECKHEFAKGTVVHLQAEAEDGWVLMGWAGDCAAHSAMNKAYVAPTCTLTMDKNHAASATFERVFRKLKVSKHGKGEGLVTSHPKGIRCGKECSHEFAAGTSVSLKAKATKGSVFAGWSDECENGDSSRSKAYVEPLCQLTVDEDVQVTATFARATACKVPKVKGKPFGKAVSAIAKAKCKLGKVERKFSAAVPKHEVISQHPVAGTELPAGGKVGLSVSKGKKHAKHKKHGKKKHKKKNHKRGHRGHR